MEDKQGLLSRNRQQLERDLTGDPRREYFSPARYLLTRALVPRLREHVHGSVLDAGCGTMPYRHVVGETVEYHGLDVERRTQDVTLIGDVQNMSDIVNRRYDSVLSLQVLEHVPRPARALSEMARVCRPGGTLVVSVPHLSRLHEEPHDFFRFTHYALQSLLDEAGFDCLEIVPVGSVFSFIGHQLSSIIVCSTWHVSLVKHLAFWVNALVVTLPCQWLDRWIGTRLKMPLGYVAVARRRED